MPRIKRIIPVGYTTVNNDFLRDTTLSLAARGLLITMLSLPDGWNMSGKGLAAILPDGRDKVFSTLNILEDKGYLRREKIRENGKFVDVEYQFCDSPIFTPPIKKNKQKSAMKKEKKIENHKENISLNEKFNFFSFSPRRESSEEIKVKLSMMKDIELRQYVEEVVLDKNKCITDFCVPVDDIDIIINSYIQLITSTPDLLSKLSQFTSFDIAILEEKIKGKKRQEQIIKKFFKEEQPSFTE